MILKKSCQLLALFVCLWTFNTGFVQEEHGQVTAILGENVILHCAFEFPDGAPVPYVIQWQKNGIKIPIYIWYDGYPPHIGEGYEDRVSLAEQASLNLTSVRESDQGWYECKVYFLNRPPDSPKNGTWVRLDVHAPPHFKTKPPDVVYVKVGESVSLPCEAEGTPPPAIIWYKDNLPLEESATVQIFATELRISNLRQSDIGDYLCMARNREGSVTTASKVIVAGPAVITTRPRNITKLEGDKAEFICEAKALPSNVTHRWFHNSVEISQLSWLETRTLLRRDGTLFINPTSAEDSGEYTCEVTNGIGNPDQASAYLSVEYPARVTYSPTIQYLPLGLSGIVRCYVQANPPFQFITWTKDRRPFDPNANPGIVTLNNGSLVFQRVSHEHQGRYRCTPYNIHGTAGTSNVMEVLVREPPMFTVKPKETYQQSVNSEVKLPCDGIGQPKPTITWRRADGGKLPRDRTVVRGGNLTIKGLRKEDHGRYECVLENEIATLVTSTLLLVESTTPHAPTNVSVNTSAFAATLTWLPAYDGGYEQTYVIWYRLAEQSDSDWRTIRVYPEGATTFTLYNLQPDVEYDFQVLSRNVLGDGKFSPTVRARTKQWDYLNGIYPTDAYGSTYIPTVQKPSGPKPGPPRNVTIQDTPQGILISWLPPANTSIRVAYYYVEYKTGRQNWQRWGPIKDGATQYLAKDLPAGQVYHFRVYAFSLMSVGEVSAEVRYQIPGDAQRQNRAKAITAGVVGGILFFIAAIVLSVCAVKICNKRKRRKAEKAYMMVTCPVADARNGGHSHAGSPVPLKKHEESGVSGLAVTALRVLSHCLANLLGHHHDSRTTFASTLPPEDWPPSPEPAPSPPRGRRFPKAVKYNVEMEFSRPLGWISRTAEGKFVLRGEADEGRGFAATNRDAHDLNPSSIRGSLRSDGSGQSMLMSPGIGNHHHLHPHRSLQPSSSMTRTFSSPHRTQYSFSPTSQALPTIYSPRDPRFRTSSPGPLAAGPLIIEDLSSVNQPSSAERSFPSTLSSHLASLSAQVTPSYELPSLRLLHENSNVRGPSRQFRPIQGAQQVQVEVHHPSQTDVRPRESLAPRWRRSPGRLGPEAGVWGDGRHIHMAAPARGFLHPTTYPSRMSPSHGLVHYRRLEPPPVSAIQKVAVPRKQQEVYERLLHREPQLTSRQSAVDQQRPLATSSPPRLDRRVARVPPSPSKTRVTGKETEPKTVATTTRDQESSESSSGDQPMTYTRDRLLGAVERVRSGALHRGGPFRHSAPELVQAAREPTLLVPTTNAATPISRRGSPKRTVAAPTVASMGFRFIAPSVDVSDEAALPRSRTSITSGSSGRGSSGQGSKAASVTHSRGDSIQGELELSAANRSSSSSGFASRNLSATLHSSTSPGSSSLQPVPASSTVATSLAAPTATSSSSVPASSPSLPILELESPLDSPHSEPIFPSHMPPLDPLDVSVDENYEFDTVSPLESELLEKLRQYSQPHARSRSRLGSGERGLSDSELYTNFYPKSKVPRKYDNTEARCAALKEEFLQFRRRQQERRRSEELESAC